MKHQIHIGAGVIDPDYTGEVKVLLFNERRHYYLIKRGDPIAQLILEKVSLPILTRVDVNCHPLIEVKEDVDLTV